MSTGTKSDFNLDKPLKGNVGMNKCVFGPLVFLIKTIYH